MGSISDEDKCRITIKDGPICGFIENNGTSNNYKFKGIPYAKPPLGRLRFLPPSPVKPWTEELDCTKDAPLPLTYTNRSDYSVIGSEDCLYVNVSSPNIKPKKLLPVMFWICNYRYSRITNIFDPTFINEENVIFVDSGFRLGAFGFMSIHDFIAPGNCGLKDLVLALKWVQKNISQFGGDPNNVTIFGSSAGGSIAHLMMLSPMADGLFHKCIIQSATALNNWSVTKNPSVPVMQLAKELGITETDKIEIVEKLRITPSIDIMDAVGRLELRNFNEDENEIFNPFFKPCIESEFEGQPAFLTKSPIVIIKSGNYNKVPMIIGCNNIEGSLLTFCKDDFYSDYEKYNENVQLLVPKSLAGEGKFTKNIGHQLLKFYLGEEETFTKNTRHQYLQLISDYFFLYYVYLTVSLHSQSETSCPVYYYVLNYAGEWSLPENLNFLNSLGHCGEIPFILGIKPPNMPVCKGSRDSIKTRSRVVRMWTNFAKYGNPTPDEDDPLLQIKWDPVQTKDRLNYLSIGSELTKGRNPFQERMTFWDELHKEHTFLRVLVYFNDLGVQSWA